MDDQLKAVRVLFAEIKESLSEVSKKLDAIEPQQMTAGIQLAEPADDMVGTVEPIAGKSV